MFLRDDGWLIDLEAEAMDGARKRLEEGTGVCQIIRIPLDLPRDFRCTV